MTAIDGALVLLLCAFLFALCAWRSRPRLLWDDELLGFHLLGDPAFRHMLKGWWEGADGGGLLYYLLARLWVRCFGLTELTLRLFSTAGMCAALALTWTAARRSFSTLTVALSIGLVYLTPAVMLWQELNGRFYGMFLASAAFAGLMFLVTADKQPSRRDLLLTTAAHTLLIGSHILGLVYSFSLIAGMIVLDLRERRSRPRLYLAAFVGWALLPVSYHAIRSSTSIATNVFWTYKPSLISFLLGLAVFGKLTVWILGALLGLALLQSLFRHKGTGSTQPNSPVFYLIGSLVLAQTLLYVKSQFGISIYADRYLLPVSVATVFLFALSLQSLLPRSMAQLRSPAAVFAVCLVGLLPLIGYASSRRTNYALYPSRGYPERITAPIPPGAPVLASLHTFTLLLTYDPRNPILFPVDWHGDDPSGTTSNFGEHLMENWRRAGYAPGQILPCAQIFAQQPDLFVFLEPYQDLWFQHHVSENPGYTVHRLAASTEWQPLTLWSVHRHGAATPPC